MALITATNIILLFVSILVYRLLDQSLYAFNNETILKYAQSGSYYNHHGRPVFTYNTDRFDSKAHNKPALLLLHGYPTSSIDWLETIDQLQSQWHCITYDYIGYGLSDKSIPYNITINTQADIAEELLLSLDIHTVHLFTHDVGDTVAQELLARQIDNTARIHIKSVYMLNGGLFPETHRRSTAQKLVLTPVIGHILQLLPRSVAAKALNQVFGPDTQLNNEQIELYTTLLYHNAPIGLIHHIQQYINERVANRERWVGAVQNVTKLKKIPIRVVDGPIDPISGRHMIEYYRTMVDHPDAVILADNIGHYPQLEDNASVIKYFHEFHKNIGTKL